MLRLAESDDLRILVEAFARTLVATLTPEKTKHIYNTFLSWSATIRRISVGLFRVQRTDDEALQLRLDAETSYNDDVIRNCTNRRFFCTTNGLTGLGPREMSPADIVVVIRGYPLPLILRPDGELVAEATLHAGGFILAIIEGMVNQISFLLLEIAMWMV
jgi:hypothetical protein